MPGRGIQLSSTCLWSWWLGEKKKRLAILAVGSLVADGQSVIGIKNKTKQ